MPHGMHLLPYLLGEAGDDHDAAATARAELAASSSSASGVAVKAEKQGVNWTKRKGGMEVAQDALGMEEPLARSGTFAAMEVLRCRGALKRDVAVGGRASERDPKRDEFVPTVRLDYQD